jgi:hypothetical protein
MARLRSAIVFSLLVGFCAVGCAPLERSGHSRLQPLRMATENVGLEIYFVRAPLGDPDINGPLWSDIDEQQVPLELRRRLAANGFRVGLVGNRLPPKLEQLLKVAETTPVAEGEEAPPMDLESEPIVRQRILQVRGGKRTHVICTGERTRHPELSVLIRGDDGTVNGRTYRKVMGIFAAKATPQGDGRVKLDLVPELEHGDPQRRFEPADGMLKMEFSAPREKFDSLRTEATLMPGQILVLSCLADRPGSLGYHYFTEQTSERVVQKLLLIRLTGTQYDNLFSAGPPPIESEE